MVERDPIVAALLQDALRRRNLQLQLDIENDDDDDERQLIVPRKLTLQTGHGADIAKSLSPSDYPHICYLGVSLFLPCQRAAAGPIVRPCVMRFISMRIC